MRLLKYIFVILLLCASAWAGPTVAQRLPTTCNNASATSITCAFASNVLANDIIVLVMGQSSAGLTTFSVSGCGVSTWTIDAPVNSISMANGTVGSLQSGGCTLTITANGATAAEIEVTGDDVTGGTQDVRGTTAASAFGTTFTCPSLTTNAADLVICASGDAGFQNLTYSLPTPTGTSIGTQASFGIVMMENTQSASGTIQIGGTYGAAANISSGAIAFNSTTAGGTTFAGPTTKAGPTTSQ